MHAIIRFVVRVAWRMCVCLFFFICYVVCGLILLDLFCLLFFLFNKLEFAQREYKQIMVTEIE